MQHVAFVFITFCGSTLHVSGALFPEFYLFLPTKYFKDVCTQVESWLQWKKYIFNI